MKPLVRVSFSLLLLSGLLCSPSAANDKVQSLCQFHYPSDYLVEWDCKRLTSRDSPYRIFGKYWKDGLRFNRMDRRHFIAGLSIKVPRRVKEIEGFNPMPPEWPDAEQAPKLIVIDQNEMFLGAYELGKLVFSMPVAVGAEGYRLRNGSYRVDAVDAKHESSLYPVEGTDKAYPMHYGLRFFIDKKEEGWTSYWMHGRDLPGYPASHGCIGLYDEEMQKKYYHEPAKPILKDAKRLYDWVVGTRDPGKFSSVRGGPKVLIMGAPVILQAEPASAPAPPAAKPAAAPLPVPGAVPATITPVAIHPATADPVEIRTAPQR